MKLQESGENYLEAILLLKQEKGAVRSIDIAQWMNFSKPSISRAMSLLRENGYIVMDKDGLIEFTPTGLETAQRVYERHTILTRFLVQLGVDEAVAAQDACRIEHVISQESFQRIKEKLREQESKDNSFQN